MSLFWVIIIFIIQLQTQPREPIDIQRELQRSDELLQELRIEAEKKGEEIKSQR